MLSRVSSLLTHTQCRFAPVLRPFLRKRSFLLSSNGTLLETLSSELFDVVCGEGCYSETLCESPCYGIQAAMVWYGRLLVVRFCYRFLSSPVEGQVRSPNLLLETKSGALFVGGFGWVSYAPANEPNTAYYPPCNSGSVSADNRIFCVPCLHGFSSFEQSASCSVPLWWAAFWQFAPPIVTLVVGIAVHERYTITGRLSLSALSLSLIAGAVLSLTRSWRCGVAIVAGSILIATRLLCRYSADTQQVLTLLGMVFLGMACWGTFGHDAFGVACEQCWDHS